MELILVMLIVALIAGILAPALIHFTAGRAVDNFGRQIVGLCELARSNATSEAQSYYVVFDAKQISLTTIRPDEQQPKQPAAQKVIPGAVPEGIKLTMGYATDQSGQPEPRAIELLPWDPNLQPQPQPLQRNSQLMDGTSGGSETIWAMPANNRFIEFGPTGRTDPMTIQISDTSGHSVEIACDSPTEGFHVVEAAR